MEVIMTEEDLFSRIKTQKTLIDSSVHGLVQTINAPVQNEGIKFNKEQLKDWEADCDRWDKYLNEELSKLKKLAIQVKKFIKTTNNIK